MDTKNTNKAKGKIIYLELSYRLIGLMYKIHNKIGGSHREKYIQEAIAIDLAQSRIPFKRELKCPLLYNGRQIGYYFLDFLLTIRLFWKLKLVKNFRKLILIKFIPICKPMI